MSRVRTRDTKPEVLVRSALHRAGFRFRLHRRDLPGKPDIVLPRFRTVVFVNGCFWHGHHCSKGKRPRTNTEFWNRKIDANVERDAMVKRELERLGWNVVTIWECSVDEAVESLVRRLDSLRT